MEMVLNVVAAAGALGSLALVGWGMVLCLAHGLDAARPANADERWLGTNLPAGTPS